MTLRSECDDNCQDDAEFEEYVPDTILRVTQAVQCHYTQTQTSSQRYTQTYRHRERQRHSQTHADKI